MRLNSNPYAMNTLRHLQNTGNMQSLAMQKLSSGKRINNAKDDAAGYAISEKMAMQIAGLQRASKNSLDGISMIQTAETALDEVHSMLQRMRELSVQAANDTNKLEDRESIQKEINQLTSEINRIGEATEFNKMKMFTADNEDGTAKPNMNIPVQLGANANQMMDIQFQILSSTSLGISGVTQGGDAFDINKVYVGHTHGTTIDEQTGAPVAPQYVKDAKYRATDELQNMSIKKRVGNVPQKDANGNFEYKKEYALDVTTASSATAAIHVYDNAISRISSMRSSLGASQNRLEHTIKTLDSSAENVTQTMSKIQDTDIAEQMSEFTKYNILQQSGTSMLSQANQLPQMILKLLEN